VKEEICDWCGKPESEVAVMIINLDIAICCECIDLAHFICEQKTKPEEP
jgi:ATP-dependent protease Clp ATPase subunit